MILDGFAGTTIMPMVNNFNAIIECLETEINEQSDKDIAQAIGNKLIK